MGLRMQKDWPLGLIGLVGFWKVPEIWAFVTGEVSSWWGLANLLWFLWFLYLLPEEGPSGTDEEGR